MQATQEELGKILQIQNIDLELLRTKKKIEELPQRRAILEIRKKKKTIEEKHTQINTIKKELDIEFTKLNAEDEKLALKQTEAQDKIAAVKGDYRSVESFTKELNGFAKRRVTLEQEMLRIDEKITQVNVVAKQANDALMQLEKQEQQQIDAFKLQGGSLNESFEALKKQRSTLAEEVDDDLMAEYQKIADRNGGIGISRLMGSCCSVCKNELSEGKVLQAQAQFPLSHCPFCKRMMVIS